MVVLHRVFFFYLELSHWRTKSGVYYILNKYITPSIAFDHKNIDASPANIAMMPKII